ASSTLFPYTTLFRSKRGAAGEPGQLAFPSARVPDPELRRLARQEGDLPPDRGPSRCSPFRQTTRLAAFRIDQPEIALMHIDDLPSIRRQIRLDGPSPPGGQRRKCQDILQGHWTSGATPCRSAHPWLPSAA